MRVWELDIGVDEAEIRCVPYGPVIIARARQGHGPIPRTCWQFIVDALNEKEQREAFRRATPNYHAELERVGTAMTDQGIDT